MRAVCGQAVKALPRRRLRSGPHPAAACLAATPRPQRDRWGAVIRGVFAGNIFDLGCAATTSMYHEVRRKPGRRFACGCWCFCPAPHGHRLGAKRLLLPSMHASLCATPAPACPWDMLLQEGVSFHDTRDKLVPRPWVVDDLGALLDRLCRCAHVPCCVWRCGRDNYMHDAAGGWQESQQRFGGQSALSASERRGGASCAGAV